VSIVTYSEVPEYKLHRDLVSTVMFYLHIVIMTNKTSRIRINYSFSACNC